MFLMMILGSACSTTGDKAQMESNTQAVADSILNANPADSNSTPKELSPDAGDDH